ncbi:MAG: hypothetical protein ACR2OL_16910 [Anderseniella sp.]
MNPDIAELADFIRTNTQLAHQACVSQEIKPIRYRFAAVPIDVWVTSASIQEVIDPVIAHARDTSDPTVMAETQPANVYAIDAASLGLAGPPSKWHFPEQNQQDYQRICWQPEDGLALTSDDSRGIWHLWDMRQVEGAYWVADTERLPYWEFASPLRHFIHWVCLEHGIAMIHAAAIGQQGHGVLLTGKGGSGKSTLTAAAVSHGWQTVGDDFVLLRFAQGKVYAYPIFDILKLTGMAEEWFADLLKQPLNPNRAANEKAMVRLSDIAGQSFVDGLEVHAIFSQTLTHASSSRFSPISKIKAVAALAPSTMNILRTAMPVTLKDCGRLAKALPTYSLGVGQDPNETLGVLENWMKSELGHV